MGSDTAGQGGTASGAAVLAFEHVPDMPTTPSPPSRIRVLVIEAAGGRS